MSLAEMSGFRKVLRRSAMRSRSYDESVHSPNIRRVADVDTRLLSLSGGMW